MHSERSKLYTILAFFKCSRVKRKTVVISKDIKIIFFAKFSFFSSPEHEVLMVSYCDQSMPVVRPVSCVVNNLF